MIIRSLIITALLLGPTLAGCGMRGELEQPAPLFRAKAKADYEAKKKADADAAAAKKAQSNAPTADSPTSGAPSAPSGAATTGGR